jgi:hypothetical protein
MTGKVLQFANRFSFVTADTEIQLDAYSVVFQNQGETDVRLNGIILYPSDSLIWGSYNDNAVRYENPLKIEFVGGTGNLMINQSKYTVKA